VVVNSVIPFRLRDALLLLALVLFILLIAQLVTTLLRAIVLLYLQTKIDIIKYISVSIPLFLYSMVTRTN